MSAAVSEALAHDQLFERNRVWAGVIVRNVVRKLPPSFESADLLQVALLEMWKRVLSYDPANLHGTPFQAYAYMAVRGACLMSVRRRNWTESQHQSLTKPREATESDNASLYRNLYPAGSRFSRASEAASMAAGPLDILINKAERKRSNDKQSRRRRWLVKQIDKLSPVDAYLITRTFIDEADLDVLAKLQGLDRATLSRRLGGIVKRLKKARGKRR